MRFIRSLYVTNQFFYALLLLATCFVLSFFIKVLFPFVIVLLWLFVAACLWDILFLYYNKNKIVIQRNYPEKLSNGDENEMEIQLISNLSLIHI